MKVMTVISDFVIFALPSVFFSPSEMIKSASAVYGRYSFSINKSLENLSDEHPERQRIISGKTAVSFNK